MKKSALLTAALLTFSALCSAQMVTVSASKLADSTGAPVNGVISFQPTSADGTPISYRLNGKGQVTLQTVSATITNGAFSLQIADTTQTSPANVCFRVWATNTKNEPVIGSKVAPSGYSCVQVTPTWCNSTSCNFDNYTPSTPSLALVQVGPQGPQGPQGTAGTNGTNGLSAYQVAVNGGFSGTQAQWLASLIGATGQTGAQGNPGSTGTQGPAGTAGTNGTNGTNGLSAYQVAVNGGFSGTQAQWLASLVGATGQTGAQGNPGSTGTQGPAGTAGTNGTNGTNGLSAYQVAVNGGFSGTQSQWLASLVGATGQTGAQGNPGSTGTQGPQGTAGTNGTNGTNGLSAYQVAVNGGFSGTQSQWLASLVGSPGATGNTGAQGAQGPAGPTNPPTTTTLGGIFKNTCGPGQHWSDVDSTGMPVCSYDGNTWAYGWFYPQNSRLSSPQSGYAYAYNGQFWFTNSSNVDQPLLPSATSLAASAALCTDSNGKIATTAGCPAGITSITPDTNVTASFSNGVLTLGWQNALAKTRLLGTTVYTDQANTYTAGQKQTFTPNGANAGLNVATSSTQPFNSVTGDLIFYSGHFNYYNGSAWTTIPDSVTLFSVFVQQSTGHVVPVVYRLAVSQKSVAGAGVSLPSTNAPTPVLFSGASVLYAALDFPHAASSPVNTMMSDEFDLTNWSGADIPFTLDGFSATADNSKTIKFGAQFACLSAGGVVGQGGTGGGSLTTALSVSVSNSATAYSFFQATSTIPAATLTGAGCSAGSRVEWQIYRDVTDTLVSDVYLTGLTFNVRRSF